MNTINLPTARDAHHAAQPKSANELDADELLPTSVSWFVGWMKCGLGGNGGERGQGGAKGVFEGGTHSLF